jgi:hypothetical protein
MPLGFLIVGVLILWVGWKARDTGAGVPLLVGGACLALFAVVWYWAERASHY